MRTRKRCVLSPPKSKLGRNVQPARPVRRLRVRLRAVKQRTTRTSAGDRLLGGSRGATRWAEYAGDMAGGGLPPRFRSHRCGGGGADSKRLSWAPGGDFRWLLALTGGRRGRVGQACTSHEEVWASSR